MSEIIRPELSANSFVSHSGVEYIVYPSVTTERFPILEKCLVEVQNGLSLSGYKTELADAYESQNKGRFADASVKMNNILNGADRINNLQPHPLLKIATLFICPSTENQAMWNEADATAKIKDWAGVDVAFFLKSVSLLLNRFFPGLRFGSQDISDEANPESRVGE